MFPALVAEKEAVRVPALRPKETLLELLKMTVPLVWVPALSAMAAAWACAMMLPLAPLTDLEKATLKPAFEAQI